MIRFIETGWKHHKHGRYAALLRVISGQRKDWMEHAWFGSKIETPDFIVFRSQYKPWQIMATFWVGVYRQSKSTAQQLQGKEARMYMKIYGVRDYGRDQSTKDQCHQRCGRTCTYKHDLTSLQNEYTRRNFLFGRCNTQSIFCILVIIPPWVIPRNAACDSSHPTDTLINWSKFFKGGEEQP